MEQLEATPAPRPAFEPSIVAIYASDDAADFAVRALRDAGMDMKRLSLVAKDFRTDESVGGVSRVSVSRALVGGALLVVPRIGPLRVLGPLVGWIVGALEDATGGGAADVFGAALANAAVPDESVVKYELALQAGRFLVLARGTVVTIVRARRVLDSTKPSGLISHGSPACTADERWSVVDASATS